MEACDSGVQFGIFSDVDWHSAGPNFNFGDAFANGNLFLSEGGARR